MEGTTSFSLLSFRSPRERETRDRACSFFPILVMVKSEKRRRWGEREGGEKRVVKTRVHIRCQWGFC